MKILLTAINAKYIHSNLAVYSLKAYAGKYQDNIEIGEYTINNQKGYILEQIYKAKPDLLTFSCYIWNIELVEELAREFHKLCPEVPIWMGGPEVSYQLKDFLEEHPEVTGIMVGEGEETFKELCAYYVEGSRTGASDKEEGSLEGIKGIAFRKGRDIIITGPRPVMNMSDIPFAYNRMEDFSNRIIYYESSRGCPFSCSYCLSSVDKALRFRDIELVKEELGFFIDQKVPQIKFVDRTFNCNHQHAMAIWQFIKEKDNGVTNFHFEVSADLLREEELELIGSMRPGLIQLEIGVQSTNDTTIREIHRTMKLEPLKEIVGRIRSNNNIHQHLDLIAGLPYEEYRSFGNSFDEIYALKPNQLQLGFLKVLKGSYMHDHAEEYGLIYQDKPPYEVLKTNWLSFDQVLAIKQVEEMLEVYYNSGQFEITMKLLDCYYDSAFEFFQRLGEFYEEKKYYGMNHSRIRRCQILLEYIEENEKELVPMVEESLIFDLYYRENCKTRPDWAVDNPLQKQMNRHYCKKGKLGHVEAFNYRFPDKKHINLTRLPEREEEPVWVHFHYDQRDPLDHQAYTEYVEVIE